MLVEVTTAVEESLAGLSDEQVWQRPIPQRHSIGTMVMHCLESLSAFACRAQLGRGIQAPVDDPAFEMWEVTPQQADEKQKGSPLPTVGQMAEWVRQVRELALEGLSQASEEDLLRNRADNDWCTRTKRPSGDAYMRCLCHVSAHIRQIWCLRGVVGTFSETARPQQHYA